MNSMRAESPHSGHNFCAPSARFKLQSELPVMLSMRIWIFMLLDFFPVAEGVSDALADGEVPVIRGVVADGVQFFHVHLVVCVEHGRIGCDVHDFAEEQFGIFVVADHFAFEREREFRNQRGVYIFALDGGEARFGELVCNLLAACDAEVVNRLDVLGSCHAYGEGLARLDVVHRLVAVGHVDGNLVHVADAAPCGDHRICAAVVVVGGDDKCRLRVQIRFRSKIFTHEGSPIFYLF